MGIEEVLKDVKSLDEAKSKAQTYYDHVKNFVVIADYNKHFSRTATSDIYDLAESFAQDVMEGKKYEFVKEKYFK